MLYARLATAIKEHGPERVWDEVTTILDPLAQGRTRLGAVRHPLGFICLPVVRDASPEGVCLHYWTGEDGANKPTTSPYHCHSWSLLSHIMVGSVGNQRLDLVPGDRYRLFRANSGRDGDDREIDDLEPTGQLTGIRTGDVEIYRAGETYELEAGAFHASVGTHADVSVTLVLGSVVPDAEDISLGPVTLGRHRKVRTNLGPDEGRRIAGEILRLRPRVALSAGSSA
ncbi:hypothetical protein [Actinoplanes philippinensis]|uniref:hypothetical protein n=1 Tax=Actinoplanes philippinensis TaxID=35752 RepID=UPI0033D33778